LHDYRHWIVIILCETGVRRHHRHHGPGQFQFKRWAAGPPSPHLSDQPLQASRINPHLAGH